MIARKPQTSKMSDHSTSQAAANPQPFPRQTQTRPIKKVLSQANFWYISCALAVWGVTFPVCSPLTLPPRQSR